MSYQTRATRDQQGPTRDAMQDLAMQIEALDVGPSPEMIAAVDILENAASAAAQRMLEKSTKTPSRSMLASKRAAPLPPKLSTGQEHTTLDAAKQATDKTRAAEAREREEFRALLRKSGPPQPEAAMKKAPVQFPSVEGGDENVPVGTKTDSRTKRCLDDVVNAVAKSREETAVPKETKPARKLTIKLRAPREGSQNRFALAIIPDEQHTTIWDGNDEDIYIWSAALLVVDTQPPSHIYSRDVLKDFSIQFRAIAASITDPTQSSCALTLPEYDVWHAEYTGYRAPASKDSHDAPALQTDRGVAVETTYRFLPPKNEDSPFVWRVRFWVPVPLGVLARAEHRTFVCQAKVSVQYGESQKMEVVAENVAVGIERLRTERLLALPHASSQ